MGDKFPLHHNINYETSKPFVGYMEGGKAVIAVEDSLLNMHGDVIYTDYTVLNRNPTKEELFKTNLTNPQNEKITIRDYTVREIHYRLKGS